MPRARARICVAADGTLTGQPSGLPPGEHEAEIVLVDISEAEGLDTNALLARVRAVQEEIARLPVLDRRNPDEIIGYNKHGHFG
jgi:hypothetical protein